MWSRGEVSVRVDLKLILEWRRGQSKGGGEVTSYILGY